MPTDPRPSAYTIRGSNGYYAGREERDRDSRYYHWVHMHPPGGPLPTRAEVVTWLESIGYRVTNADRTDAIDNSQEAPPSTP